MRNHANNPADEITGNPGVANSFSEITCGLISGLLDMTFASVGLGTTKK